MDVVPFVLGLVLVVGLLIVAIVKLRGISRKEATSREEDKSERGMSQVDNSVSVDGGATLRYIVLAVFFCAFFIGIVGFLTFLSALPPGFSSTSLNSFFIYMILLDVCFLAVVYWVAKDGETMDNMKNRIAALEEERRKTAEKD